MLIHLMLYFLLGNNSCWLIYPLTVIRWKLGWCGMEGAHRGTAIYGLYRYVLL